jgi:predicted RNA methylase
LGNRRVTGKEQYYTPDSLALQLIDEVVAVTGKLSGRTILEPAGGTGAFLKAAAANGVTDFASFDIDPKFEGIRRGDFLDAKLRLPAGSIAISNPPFGRNNSLSIPFFNKAAEHVEFICFIVPRSWRKWSVINRLDRRFELVADHDLQIDYVDDGGELIHKKLSLKTCFQIWRRLPEGHLRPLYRVTDNALIEKTTPELADVALRVFGFGCGRVLEDFERKPNSTLMFLKLRHPKAREALRNADFERFFRNTAYTEALSLPEINYLLNEAILGDPMLQTDSETSSK